MHAGANQAETHAVAADRRGKICIVTTTPLIVNFFLGNIIEALARRYVVSLIVNTDDGVTFRKLPSGIKVYSVPLERKTAPLKDLVASWHLWQIFRREHFDAVHSFAPKAGLLAMLAAKLAGIPVRIHTFQGEVWAARRGILRWLYKSLDTVTAKCTTDALVISHSERDFLIRQGVLVEDHSRVLADGSVCGVDATRFETAVRDSAAIRNQLGIAADKIVFLYLGRLTRDKGVLDLARAFAAVAARHNNTELLIVGPDEENLTSEIRRRCGNAGTRVHIHGYTDHPERYIGAADVVCLPSYREGFGMVLIEAGAAGLPVIASRIYGIADAILDSETALLHSPGDVAELANHMTTMIENPAQRRTMGIRAREWVSRRFSRDRVIEAYLDYYGQVLG